MAIIFPKTLRAPMKPYRANYNRVIFFTCFAIVMIVVGIECIQFFTEKKWILEDLHSRLKEHTVGVRNLYITGTVLAMFALILGAAVRMGGKRR